MGLVDEKRIILPGEEIGTSEEFMAGEGTYEEEGRIYAECTGVLEIDSSEMVARVKSLPSTPIILKAGDLVIGYVNEIKGNIAVIDVIRLSGSERAISSDTSGSIHISKVSEDYISSIGWAFRVGDIIRAKVIQTEPSLQLSTIGAELGVLKSLCIACRTPLVRKDQDLYCPNCERLWQKKIASDYGEGKL
jgi:exosome complex component CSL4